MANKLIELIKTHGLEKIQNPENDCHSNLGPTHNSLDNPAVDFIRISGVA